MAGLGGRMLSISLISASIRLSEGLITVSVEFKELTASGSVVSAILSISAVIPSALAAVILSASKFDATSLDRTSAKPSRFAILVKSISDLLTIVV